MNGGGGVRRKTSPAFATVCTARQYIEQAWFYALAGCQWVFLYDLDAKVTLPQPRESSAIFHSCSRCSWPKGSGNCKHWSWREPHDVRLKEHRALEPSTKLDRWASFHKVQTMHTCSRMWQTAEPTGKIVRFQRTVNLNWTLTWIFVAMRHFVRTIALGCSPFGLDYCAWLQPILFGLLRLAAAHFVSTIALGCSPFCFDYCAWLQPIILFQLLRLAAAHFVSTIALGCSPFCFDYCAWLQPILFGLLHLAAAHFVSTIALGCSPFCFDYCAWLQPIILFQLLRLAAAHFVLTIALGCSPFCLDYCAWLQPILFRLLHLAAAHLVSTIALGCSPFCFDYCAWLQPILFGLLRLAAAHFVWTIALGCSPFCFDYCAWLQPVLFGLLRLAEAHFVSTIALGCSPFCLDYHKTPLISTYVFSGLATEQVLIFGAVLTFGGYDKTEWKILQERSLFKFSPVLSAHNTLLCMFQRLWTYFQDTGGVLKLCT